MNWQMLEGKYKEHVGAMRAKWGKLTDDDLEMAKGKRDVLVGKLQQRYGMAKDEAEKQLDSWVETL
jgi:uncharacterized protein YjbJ (UPF0337 family)